MPTVQDEEESLCLLASDLQDLPMASAASAASAAASNETGGPINPDEDEDWACDEKSSFLGQGHAEKAFFNVCKTQEDEDEAEEAMEVMNDIIGTLEADHISPPIPVGLPANPEKESRNSRSLVVDIHLPPASEDDEDEEQPQSCSTVAPASTSRPCKHEVNRFQRCYSDGSQSSPKRKSKVKIQGVWMIFDQNIPKLSKVLVKSKTSYRIYNQF